MAVEARSCDPAAALPGEALSTTANGSAMGTITSVTPQVVDDRRAEGQGELVAWLCQQDAAGRTSSGPPGIELCNCSILNNYEPIRGKCQLKVCEWRSE